MTFLAHKKFRVNCFVRLGHSNLVHSNWNQKFKPRNFLGFGNFRVISHSTGLTSIPGQGVEEPKEKEFFGRKVLETTLGLLDFGFPIPFSKEPKFHLGREFLGKNPPRELTANLEVNRWSWNLGIWPGKNPKVKPFWFGTKGKSGGNLVRSLGQEKVSGEDFYWGDELKFW